MVGKCLKATVKVHPTVWMDTFDPATGLQVDQMFYSCLNPLDNKQAAFEIDWVIFSNLPFYKTVSYKPFTWAEQQGLKSYEFIDGEWVLVARDLTFTDTLDNQQVYIDGMPVASGWISDVINYNPDVHDDTERVKWEFGPINFCTTAGYYTGSLCLAVYQN